MPSIPEFTDPRLVAVYDAVNAYGPGEQPEFYGDLADRTRRSTVVEVGCGTGLVSLELARRRHRVTGVDPSAAMLDAARAKPDADRVQWVHGGVDALGYPDAHLVVMAGHVAQFFVTDMEWTAALTAIRAALRTGGTLAFESRNPDARAWESWTEAAARTFEVAGAGAVRHWSVVSAVRDQVVTYANHYRFEATGEELVSPAALRFRDETDLGTSLTFAGFAVEAVLGDWDGRPVTADAPELIVVARAI